MHEVYVSFTDGDYLELTCKSYKVFDGISIFYTCIVSKDDVDMEREAVVVANQNLYAIGISKKKDDG